MMHRTQYHALGTVPAFSNFALMNPSFTSQSVRAVARQALQTPIAQGTTLGQEASDLPQVPADVQPSDLASPVDAAVESRCRCLVALAVEGARAQGQTLPPDAEALLLAACRQDPDAFAASLEDRGISTEGCKPWYHRRTTMIVGGVAALALVAGGAYLLLGGRR